MKLKLTKAWYENRAKIENTCSEVAAGISLKPNLENDATTQMKRSKTKVSAAEKNSKAVTAAKRPSQN